MSKVTSTRILHGIFEPGTGGIFQPENAGETRIDPQRIFTNDYNWTATLAQEKAMIRLKRIIPHKMKHRLKKFSWRLQDGLFKILGQQDPLLPPKELIESIGGNFAGVGEEFAGYFKDLCGLKPDQSVLDVGCGTGRMAVPLTQYLSSTGSYHGFDIMPECVEWCRSHITSRYPNFHFQLADIYNLAYNPGGKAKASDYSFPYPDESFDLVILTSVFTHMFPPDVDNYFSNISRVLKPGGKCLITFLLINEQSLELIRAGKSKLDLKHNHGQYFTTNPETPEEAIGLPENFVLTGINHYRLKVEQPIRYGVWSGRHDGFSFQDIIVAVKETRP